MVILENVLIIIHAAHRVNFTYDSHCTHINTPIMPIIKFKNNFVAYLSKQKQMLSYILEIKVLMLRQLL